MLTFDVRERLAADMFLHVVLYGTYLVVWVPDKPVPPAFWQQALKKEVCGIILGILAMWTKKHSRMNCGNEKASSVLNRALMDALGYFASLEGIRYLVKELCD